MIALATENAVKTTLLAMLILMSPAPLGAQSKQSDSAAAAAVWARHTAAVGGERSLTGWEHMVVEMTMQLDSANPAGSARMTFEMFRAPPNKVLTRSNMPGIGTIESGFDGKVGWSNSTMTGPVLLEGKALDALRTTTGVPTPSRPAKSTMAGRRNIDGRPVIALRVVADTLEAIQYFDVESGLMVAVGSARTLAGSDSGLMIFADYRKMDGILRGVNDGDAPHRCAMTLRPAMT